jgi:hypothetical protein
MANIKQGGRAIALPPVQVKIVLKSLQFPLKKYQRLIQIYFIGDYKD